MQYAFQLVTSLISAVLAVAAVAAPGVSVEASAQDRSAPAQLEFIDRTATSATFSVSTSWRHELSRYLEGAADSDTVRVRRILQAAEGFRELSALVDLSGDESPTVRTAQADFEEVEVSGAPGVLSMLEKVVPSGAAEVVGVGRSRGRLVGTLVSHMLTFDPAEGLLRRVRSLRVTISFEPTTRPRQSVSGAGVSADPVSGVLSEGTWFKFPVGSSGIYRIDRSYIADSLGLNPSRIDPAQVGVYGNGGEPLPAPNDASRPEGLLAVPAMVEGGGDGSFDAGDYVLFYAEGPTGWNLSSRNDGAPAWGHYVNPFANAIRYFVRVDDPDAARVEDSPLAATPSGSARQTFTERGFVERDEVNLAADGGSGLDWLSRSFERGSARTVLEDRALPGIVGDRVEFRVRAAAASTRRSEIALRVDGTQVGSVEPPAIFNTSIGHVAYARRAAFEATGVGQSMTVSAAFVRGAANASGYMDWLEFFYERELAAQEDYLRFHTSAESSGPETFELDGFSEAPIVWDVTSPGSIAQLPIDGSGAPQIALAPSQPRELVAFTLDSPGIQIPRRGRAVERQNLRQVSGYPDGVIITPDTFRTQAEKLAAFRESQGLDVLVTTVEDIYNEFSGGTPDMRAVRDYLKFLYDRASDEPRMLRYALLFGDGHVDYRNLTNPSLENWVLPYETEESLRQIATYTSDDYFGLLDDDEGAWEWEGSQPASHERVDIGIGRLPVQSASQASAVVAKLKRYREAGGFGPWRGEYTMIADDGPTGSGDDRDLHTQNMEAVAQVVRAENRTFNVNKIYAQSYPAQVTAAGRRVPGARDDMIRAIEDGTLLWNYTGHGGPTALAQERLFELEDIELLQNAQKPTIGITATCSFGHWDMPDRQSGAEQMVLRETGGAIAMLTTVRIVFTSTSIEDYNVGLNRELSRAMLNRGDDGRPRRLGDIMRITKNTHPGRQGNNRKFNLIGDPMMRIGIPDHPGRMVQLDGVTLTDTDTTVSLPALKEVTLSGEVLGFSGQRESSFNGTATFTVFDARRQVRLRPEQTFFLPDSSDSSYTVRSDVVYRGRTRVKDGTFSSSFVVPKDISYSTEPARLSFYVQSDARDGFGATERLRLNGTAENPVTDPAGPQVELFLDDTTFVSGGLTGTSPELIVKLQDDTGLNSAGAGVGHETLLTVDGEEQEAVDIGRYFESGIGSSRKGEIRYTLPRQEPGPHTLRVTSWDVVNNSTEVTLDYYVAPEEDLTIRNLYNYPNPTSGPTRFIVEHNQNPGTIADVQVRIYTVSGRPVRTISRQMTLTSGPLQIPWDGVDEDLDPLATGVYLYKVRIAVDPMNSDKKIAERIERLAILR